MKNKTKKKKDYQFSIDRFQVYLALLCVFGLIIISFSNVSAQNPNPALISPQKKRPKIGLVLSGGGARGFAHIGVLKVLEENHIPVADL